MYNYDRGFFYLWQLNLQLCKIAPCFHDHMLLKYALLFVVEIWPNKVKEQSSPLHSLKVKFNASFIKIFGGPEKGHLDDGRGRVG